MIRRALLLTLAMTGVATAQPAAPPSAPPPVARVTQPAGWILDPPGSSRVAAGLGADGLFAGVPISVDAQVWTAPSHHVVLVTTQVSTDQLPADPDAAANATLHEIRAGADAVAGAVIDRWMVVVDPAGKVHEASLVWRDPSVGTTTIIRALVFRAGGALARIAGECVVGPDGAADRPACEQALATIAPQAATFEAVKVTADAPAAAAPAGDAPMPTTGPRLGGGAPSSLREGGDVPATIMVRPPAKQTDRRPLYLLGGVAVLALVFLWNRRERQRREAAERAEEARRNRRRRGAGAADDAKADDAKADDAKAEKERES